MPTGRLETTRAYRVTGEYWKICFETTSGVVSYRIFGRTVIYIQQPQTYRCNVRVLEILWRSQSHVGVDSDLIRGLKTWIQKQVFDDFSTVAGRLDGETDRIVGTADTLATLMELGIESDVRNVKTINTCLVVALSPPVSRTDRVLSFLSRSTRKSRTTPDRTSNDVWTTWWNHTRWPLRRTR